MDEKDKFQEAQQQLQILFNASQMASLPARDHQAVQQAAQSLADFLQGLNPNSNSGGDTSIAMPDEVSAE
jgi:hypothetical protein